jgi:predicted outer membrane repeat protein
MNFKRNVLVLSILICIFFSISCVAAGDVNDTDVAAYENQAIADADDDAIASTQDDVVSSSKKGTFTELQGLIDNASAGSTITLEKDYSYDSAFNSTKGIRIGKDLTINGNGHTLNGLSKSRIFFVVYGLNDNYNVVLKNINFKNGFTKLYGGAIFNYANLTVNKCTFKNNYANTTAGAICSIGSLTCKNSKFEKNTANGDAGAVFSLNVKNNVQIFNSIYRGSSIIEELEVIYQMMMNFKLIPLTDHISNCKFTNNVALGRGGGAVYAYTHINIASCTFTSNKANEVGGAVYGAKNINIKKSKFTSNSVYEYGGAVYFKCHEITGGYDSNGNWKSGIVFYSCLIKDCTFTKNTAQKLGGAIYGFKYPDLPKKPGAQAHKCTFKDNLAKEDGNELYGGSMKNCIYKNTLTLKEVKVKRSASSLVLTATLKQGSKIYKNKKITFTFNGVTYKAKTNSKGVAKVIVSSNVLKKLKVGKKVKYQATYSKLIDRKTSQVLK